MLDEESAQVRELPRACPAQHNKLQKRPLHDPRVRGLALIPELGLAFLCMVSIPSLRINSATPSLTRWNTCSLRISCSRLLISFTRCTISAIFSLSLLSISLVSPIARSRCSRIPFGWLLNHPELCAWLAQKHSLCSPESIAVNVNRPLPLPFWFTTRWSLSKVSSTVMRSARSSFSAKRPVAMSFCSALYWPVRGGG